MVDLCDVYACYVNRVSCDYMIVAYGLCPI